MADTVQKDQRFAQKSVEYRIQREIAPGRGTQLSSAVCWRTSFNVNDAGRTSQSIARSKEGCESAAQTCLGDSTDLQPSVSESPSSLVHLTLPRHCENSVLAHDSFQRDCFDSRSSCVRNKKCHSSHVVYTVHNQGGGVRIGVHNIRENANWENDYIGCGEVRHC